MESEETEQFPEEAFYEQPAITYWAADSIEGAIEPKPLSFFYQLGLLLVAGAMLVLPVIYLALIVAAAWGVYWYAVHAYAPIMAWPIGWRLVLIKVFCYLTPLFAGGILVLFMIKPLFAPRGRRNQPLALNPAVEPQLYTFIHRICLAVGSPAPARIDLTTDLNASASFKNAGSLFTNELVLTIGLPLVVGFTARELAGVIAHEFGHFRQGVAMRMSWLINTINIWFARVVHGRDGWDEKLDDLASEAESGYVTFAVLLAQLSVGMSRLILRVLMMIGFAISGFLSRQMEFDADQCEIQLSGSEAFESVCRKLGSLGVAWSFVGKSVNEMWRKDRSLPDSLPRLLDRVNGSIPEDKRQEIEDSIGLGTAGFFDTHPSTAERVRQARQMQSPGICHLDVPARELFGDFETTARIVTMEFYRDELEIPLSEVKMAKVLTREESETARAAKEAEEAAAAAAEAEAKEKLFPAGRARLTLARAVEKKPPGSTPQPPPDDGPSG